MKKAVALLMGILIVAVIMVLVSVLGYNTLKALSSGTNIADQTIANQGAEAGIENAISSLSDIASVSGGHQALIDNDWFGVESVTYHIMCVFGGCGTAQPANNDPYYLRRDMTNIAGSGVTHSNINDGVIPNHQYWNYKVWRKFDPSDPDDPDAVPALNWPSNSWLSPTSTTPNLITFRLSDRAPACKNSVGSDDTLNNCDNSMNYTIDDGVYSFSTHIRGIFNDVWPPSPPPASVRINFWSWTDNCSSMIVVDNIPRLCHDSSIEVPNGMSQNKAGSEFFSTTGSSVASTPSTGEVAGVLNNYAHIYYNLVPSSSIPSPDTWTSLTRTAAGINGVSFPIDYYIIDAVGMFGIEKVYKRVIFDPNTMITWRVNHYY